MKPTASFSALAGSGRLKTATRTSLHAPYAAYFRLDSFTAALSASRRSTLVHPLLFHLILFPLTARFTVKSCSSARTPRRDAISNLLGSLPPRFSSRPRHAVSRRGAALVRAEIIHFNKWRRGNPANGREDGIDLETPGRGRLSCPRTLIDQPGQHAGTFGSFRRTLLPREPRLAEGAGRDPRYLRLKRVPYPRRVLR